MDAELALDREGRDEELSIREGDLVEVTSVDRQLHGLSGFLADAGAPDGLRLPVNWRGSAPTGLTALGRVAARAPLGGRADRRRDLADRARGRHPGALRRG